MTTTPSRYGRTIYLRPGDNARSVSLRRRRLTSESQGNGYDEAWLQEMLFRNPELLPIGEIDDAFGPATPLCRELPTAAGPIDVAYVSESGRLTLVECKLWRNPEARREVVAQILDYAKEINRWSYEELDAAVRRARRPEGDGRGTYDLVQAQSETLDEAAFVDDVTRNLADGRFLLLVVGDGIREGVERIAEHLRRFAGIQFTFGLVELAMFELPADDTPGGLVVEPRVLARTVEIERAVVRRADSAVTVEEAEVLLPTGRRARRRITEDEFYEDAGKLDAGLPAQLKEFFGRAEDLGLVVTVGGASMILRWQREDGAKVNFGTLFPDGTLNTNYIAESAEEAGDLQVGVDYLEAVKGLIPGSKVKRVGNSWTWRVVMENRLPKFTVALERAEEWLDAIQQTMDAFRRLATD